MASNPLDDAERLYARRRWADLIQLLEPLSPMYRENRRFCYLLATAYLHSEDIGGAYSYFRRAQSLDFRDPDIAAGMAAVLVRRGESDKAVQLYIDILERFPGNTRATRALGFLRRQASSGDDDVDSGRLRGLYPGPGFNYRPLAVAAACVVAVLVLALAAPRLLSMAGNANPPRPGVSDVVLAAEDLAEPVGSGGGFLFVLTEREAVDAFDRAKRLFLDYRDEAALVEINRLRLSNASSRLKAKAEALAVYAREPSFLSLPDRYEWADVSALPALYNGVGVAWKGLPANLESGDGWTRFDLLVGYHDKNRLLGIVPVRFPFELSVDPDSPIEVLGRVRSGSANDARFTLDGIAVHAFNP